MENISLAFEKVNIIYTEQAGDHSGGSEHEIEYELPVGE